MEKFTKIKDEKPKKEEKKYNVVFDGYIKVIESEDWQFISESDCVVCLVYLKDESCILMRVEPVKSWDYRYYINNQKNPNRYLTLISGTIENGETPQQTLRRELYEEAGLVLSEFYQFEIEGPFFQTKGSSANYYTCLLSLSVGEYKFVMAPGDGSKSEKLSKTIKVSLSDIDDIKINDMVSQYLITKLKLEQNIK